MGAAWLAKRVPSPAGRFAQRWNLELLQKERKRSRTRAGLIITHTGHILDYVNATKGYVLLNGSVTCERDAHECLDSIKKNGYEGCVKCLK